MLFFVVYEVHVFFKVDQRGIADYLLFNYRGRVKENVVPSPGADLKSTTP